jgi:hypothetical protein
MQPIALSILGAQKAATTALFEMLRQHPGLFMPAAKEDNFFANDESYAKGETHLALAYAGAAPGQLLGHAYVNLLYYARAAAPRMHAHNPGMKLVALLRDPIDRAYSAYWYARMRGWESAATFEEALENETCGRISPQFAHQGILTYQAHGHYAEQLQVFFDTFGREAVQVYFQDDLKTDPQAVCSAIFAALGLPDHPVRPVTANEAAKARFPAVSAAIVNDSPIKTLYKKLVPYPVRFRISRGLMQRVQAMNREPARYPPMTAETRARLAAYYEPHNRKLHDLLGRSF